MKLSVPQKFAVIYRSENKKILHNQLELAEYMLRVLQESYQLKMLTSVGETQEKIDTVYQNIYFKPMPSEDPIADDETFQYKRLFMRDYLKQIYDIQTKN